MITGASIQKKLSLLTVDWYEALRQCILLFMSDTWSCFISAVTGKGTYLLYRLSENRYFSKILSISPSVLLLKSLVFSDNLLIFDPKGI